MNFYIGSGFKNCDMVNYVSQKLKEAGWKHTYNWADNILGYETLENLIEFSNLEIQGINDADIVIILLPGGRGTHIELGMSLALNKKIYLYSNDDNVFKDAKETVNFYQLPSIVKLTGNIDECIEKIKERA